MAQITTVSPKITRKQALKRLTELEDSLHSLLLACDVAGYKEAANAIDYIVTYCTDPVYEALSPNKREG